MIFVDVVERVSFLTYEFKQFFWMLRLCNFKSREVSRVTLLASACVGIAPLNVLPSTKC